MPKAHIQIVFLLEIKISLADWWKENNQIIVLYGTPSAARVGEYVQRDIGLKSMFRLLKFQISVFSPIKSLTCGMDDKHFGNSVEYFK